MKTLTESVVHKLIDELPLHYDQHARSTDTYHSYAALLRTYIESHFKHHSLEKQPFGPIGDIVFPYFKMGNRDSLDLFDMDELIIFSFYWVNRDKYRNILDIGANIGLHSLILSKCGYQVNCFEPDPVHFKQQIGRAHV